MAKKLSNNESLVIWASQHRADASVSEIAKLTGLREHTVRHTFNKLIESKTLRPLTFIDPTTLGFLTYDINLSLTLTSSSQRQKFISFLMKHQRVSFVMEVGGEYDFLILVMARSPIDVNDFLFEISETFGDVILSKVISLRQSYRGFGRKYLVNKKQPIVVRSTTSPSIVEIDEIDHRILQDINKHHSCVVKEISRRLGQPNSTVDYRIKKLQEHKVIGRLIYGVDSTTYGMHYYRVLVFMRTVSRSLAERVEQFCANQPHIVHLVSVLGTWDFEIGVEVYEEDDAPPILSNLRCEFARELLQIKVFPVFKFAKIENYPFNDYPFSKGAARK